MSFDRGITPNGNNNYWVVETYLRRKVTKQFSLVYHTTDCVVILTKRTFILQKSICLIISQSWLIWISSSKTFSYFPFCVLSIATMVKNHYCLIQTGCRNEKIKWTFDFLKMYQIAHARTSEDEVCKQSFKNLSDDSN